MSVVIESDKSCTFLMFSEAVSLIKKKVKILFLYLGWGWHVTRLRCLFCDIGAGTFTEAMKIGSEVYHHLKKVIKDKFGLDATAVGDEGGFAPNIQNNKEGLQLIKDAIDQAGYTGKVEIGMDVAASEFFR